MEQSRVSPEAQGSLCGVEQRSNEPDAVITTRANVSKSAVVGFSRGILELGGTSSPKIIKAYIPT